MESTEYIDPGEAVLECGSSSVHDAQGTVGHHGIIQTLTSKPSPGASCSPADPFKTCAVSFAGEPGPGAGERGGGGGVEGSGVRKRVLS